MSRLPTSGWWGVSLNDTDIRWTDKTWNPVHGCSKTSEGCRNCYAARTSQRFGHTDAAWTIDNAEQNVQVKRHKLGDLDSLPGPRWVFVNSMSDLFRELVPPVFVGDVLGRCVDQPRSAFQVLTKHGPDDDRSAPPMPWNVMLGISCESPRRRYRLDWLREQTATTKFVSFEPVVECIPEVDLSGIDWVIIGGESGPQHREMDPEWARTLVRECRRQDVAVFFKKHSGPEPEGDVRLDLGDGPERLEEFPELPGDVVPAPVEFLAAEVGGVTP